ncbi:MAG: Fibro-slime domain protein [Deltaproteobacteria bacterium]|nr:Fibro-slime domain protein [Deltaproteobacteria bacterium]
MWRGPRKLTLLIGLLAGCDQVFGLARDDCGNAELDLGEECDDGPTGAGDGCGLTCLIEPGFECPTPGAFCLPVVGLRRGTERTTLPAAGNSGGGTPYAHLCEQGDVVVGFEGATSNSGTNVGTLRALCGSLGTTPSGDAAITRTSQSLDFGFESNAPALTAICAEDAVAIGFVPNIGTMAISGFQWTCQRLSHTGGALRFGPSEFRAFGPLAGTTQSEERCPPGEVVSSIFGSAGGLVDSLGLRCSAISTVLCGDGTLVLPETCDDGNVSPGDGCSNRCVRE